MKAAVLYQAGEIPKYADFPDPVPQKEEETVVRITAASVKNIDRMRAAGTHYDSYRTLPAVVGMDGVGILEDGTRVFTGSTGGMIAEKAIAIKNRCIPLPDNIDDITAAALPNPGLSAWFALSYRAAIKPGETVLVMGATGVTGKLAVQLARQFGAGRVIAAGRNREALDAIGKLWADTTISLAEPEDDLKKSFEREAKQNPFDIILDYVWGRPAEILLDTLTGHDFNAEPRRTRYIEVGEMAGPVVRLQGSTLRSSGVEIYGIGGGSIPKEEMMKVPTKVLPQLFQMAAEKKLIIETEVAPLKDIEKAWQRKDISGKRLVIVPF